MTPVPRPYSISHFAIALAFLAWAALAEQAHAITFSGYENPATFKPGTERTFPTLSGSSGFYLSGELLERDLPAWAATAAADLPGIFRACYNLTARPSTPAAGQSSLTMPLVVALAARDSSVTAENFNIWSLIDEPDHFTFHAALDLNGNGKFEPDEVQEAQLRPNPREPRRWEAKPVFPLTALKSGDGKPAAVTLPLTLYDYGHPDWEKMQEGALHTLSRGVYLARSMRVSGALAFPDKIEWATVKGPARIQFKEAYAGDRLSFPKYTLYLKRQGIALFEPQGPGAVPLNEPLLADGRWLAIKSIAPDLSKVTLAEMTDAAPHPTRAQPGDTLPGFTRADILTRRFIKSPELQGKTVIISFPAAPRTSFNQEMLFNGFRLMSRRLRQAAGNDRLAIIFICSSVRIETLLAELAGYESLPFTILLDRDPAASRSPEFSRRPVEPPPDLSQFFYRDRTKPLTVVADPSGKIILREEQDLYSLLRQVQALLKPGSPPSQ